MLIRPKNKSSAPRWDHQASEFEKNRDKRSRALIWPMRSGKSRHCIDVGCHQHKAKGVEGIIVIAPSGVHLNWAWNEIPTWGWTNILHQAFAWETTKQFFPEKTGAWQSLLRHRGLKWMCINMEALAREDCQRAVMQFMKACHYKFGVIVSEAHHFGRPNAKRTYKARNLTYHATFVRTETGTPILTGPLRAFSQYELLAPGALGYRTYGEFEKAYAEMVPMGAPGPRTRKKVEKYINLPKLTRDIARWTSLVLRSDLGDMPELLRTERPVVMSDKQRKAYLQMVALHLAEVEDSEVTAKDAGPRMMKLQQILGGYIADTETKRILEIDPDAPIYDATIDEVLGTLPGKALVWCRYKEECRRLTAKMRAQGLNVLEYWGDFSMTQRELNRMKFLEPGNDAHCVGTADCGGEGLDFSAADAVIFHSGNPNARLMAQAEERATVKGGKNIASVRVRHYGTVCDRIWEIVDGNISLADTVTGRGLRKMLEETDV
jgi:hypothetical protein